MDKRDPMFAAGLRDIRRTDRATGFGDGTDAMSACVIHVVAERKRTVGDERNAIESCQPPRTVIGSELGGRYRHRFGHAPVFVRREIALGKSDLVDARISTAAPRW